MKRTSGVSYLETVFLSKICRTRLHDCALLHLVNEQNAHRLIGLKPKSRRTVFISCHRGWEKWKYTDSHEDMLLTLCLSVRQSLVSPQPHQRRGGQEAEAPG